MDHDRESTAPSKGRNWASPWFILLVLLGPAAISLLVLSADSSNYGENGIIAFVVACPMAGLIAAGLTNLHLRHLTTGTRTAAIIGLGILYTAAAGAVSFGGCWIVFGVFFS
jgi:hypothetical protein